MAFYYPRRTRPIDYASLGLQLYGLKQRGDIAKGRQALTAKEQAMKERQFGKLYGKTKLTGTPTHPTQKGYPSGLKEERIAGTEEINLAKAQQVADWEKFINSPSDLADVNKWAANYPPVAPFFNQIKTNVMDAEAEGKTWTRKDSYNLAKQEKTKGKFMVYAADLNDAADKLEQKKDPKSMNQARDFRMLAKQIVRPGFIDELYKVPDALKPKATGTLEEFEAKERIKAKYKGGVDKIPPEVEFARKGLKDLMPKNSEMSMMLAALVADYDTEKANKMRTQIPKELRAHYDAYVKVLDEYLGVDRGTKRFIFKDNKMIPK